MEFKDVLAARHSVRRFDGRPVDRALIDGIISEAGLAPSSKNSRSSGFVVVDDPELLDALSQMREDGCAFLKGAPAAIVVTGDSSKTDLWVDNAAISATYIMLSATARGLGSCWVHVNGRTRNRHDADNGYAEDYVRGLLGLEDPVRVLCVVALGYGA